MDFLARNSNLLLEKSMDFLWAKQKTILDNVSNVETPGYRAKVVTFEETLRDNLRRAEQSSNNSPVAMRKALTESHYTVREHPGITRMDDNGVNLTQESVEMARNAFQLQYTMNAMNSEFNVLRMAVRGQ